MTNHVMLDLETLGTGSDAPIVSIGAVLFDSERILDTFYQVVELKGLLEVDLETVQWWMQQPDEPRQVFNDPGALPIRSSLDRFSHWLDKGCCMWGNGAGFDNVILANCYKRIGIDPPWSHRLDRCFRTVKNLYSALDIKRSGVHHNALDDAVYQAEHLLLLSKQNGGFLK